MINSIRKIEQAHGAQEAKPAGYQAFAATIPLGEFLFAYLHHRGVRHSFGVLGDFALPIFGWLEKSKIRSMTMTHDPSAGFAADASRRSFSLESPPKAFVSKSYIFCGTIQSLPDSFAACRWKRVSSGKP